MLKPLVSVETIHLGLLEKLSQHWDSAYEAAS